MEKIQANRMDNHWEFISEICIIIETDWNMYKTNLKNSDFINKTIKPTKLSKLIYLAFIKHLDYN